jgi:Ca-activated chloride channel family protein
MSGTVAYKGAMMRKYLWIASLAAAASFTCAAQETPMFHADTRLVQVYVTVQDHHGRYVDGLGQNDFQISDDGKPQKIKYFESNSDALSCALLVDTTGSMEKVLPTLKNSVVSLIGEFSPKDSIAIYSFAEHLTVQQAFTTDQASAKRATLRLQAAGKTALFDALSKASVETAKQPGKKALIVFTDGEDNASVINANAAAVRAKKSGLPVFTIAEGDATQSPKLEKMLTDIAKATGGASYEVKNIKDIDDVFHKISNALQHMYLLGYDPSFEAADNKWHAIAVAAPNVNGSRVHAKDGYTPEE